MDQLRSQKSSASSSNRSFLSRALIRREESSDASKDPKGPLGLNTLYEPPGTAITDLVFVHGLGGGSQSTWTQSGDATLYWPKTWLPHDNGFRDVRIHSFGYNSNWETESTLNIHDFAKSLLGSIQDCPAIPRDSNVRTFPLSRDWHQVLICGVSGKLLANTSADTNRARWP